MMGKVLQLLTSKHFNANLHIRHKKAKAPLKGAFAFIIFDVLELKI